MSDYTKKPDRVEASRGSAPLPGGAQLVAPGPAREVPAPPPARGAVGGPFGRDAPGVRFKKFSDFPLDETTCGVVELRCRRKMFRLGRRSVRRVVQD